MSDRPSRTRLARAAKKLAATAGAMLPPLVLMTDDERLPDPVSAALALPPGSLVVVRSRRDARRQALAALMREVARARGLFLSVAGDAGLALALNADGVHLPEARIGAAAGLRGTHDFLLTASAHSPAALRRAAAVDALILSAVFATASHPGKAALGPLRASLIARQMPLPVYALGGVTGRNAARLSGFCGLAAIGALAV